jgi:hypothetical protein
LTAAFPSTEAADGRRRALAARLSDLVAFGLRAHGSFRRIPMESAVARRR